MTSDELATFYKGKKVLLVGGTRGVGFGTALAMTKAGADITVVGRSDESGKSCVEKLKQFASSTTQKVNYIKGDLGTVKSSFSLLTEIETYVKQNGVFDYMVQSAAIFPDWEKPLLNEDGLDKTFGVAVVGRFIIQQNVDKFMDVKSKSTRILNVFAPGMNVYNMDCDLASGKKTVTGLIEALYFLSAAFEILQAGLEDKGKHAGITRVTTHPGFLKTDLHRGQGWLFDLMETIMYWFRGITEEECGTNQASILASSKLHEGKLSIVDEGMSGRIRSESLNKEVSQKFDFLLKLLEEKTGIKQ
jgi:NAD(P)-dependent dehydrogenase (short-subunit alcohol dehydrogenase family)